MNAKNFRAFILALFSHFFNRLKSVCYIFGTLSHGRCQKARRPLSCKEFRNSLKRFNRSVHRVRSARAVDMLVDKPGDDNTVRFENRFDIFFVADIGNSAVFNSDIRFDYSYVFNINFYVF